MISFFRKLKWLTQRRRWEAELRDELQFHLNEEAEERLAEGLTAEQARWAARRDLGNIASIQEDTRTMWGWTILEQIGQDVRYAVRTMTKAKVFTTLAVLSLALGIGANTAIYSFMDSILLRSLPVSDPESLAVLNWQAKGTGRAFVMHSMDGSTYLDKSGITSGIFPFPAFELFRKSGSEFGYIFAYHPASALNLTAKGQAEVVSGEYVSGDYFRGLAIRPAAGRLINSDDDQTAAPPAAVVSYAYSQRRFGIADNAAGQSILIDNVPFTVVGVTPPGFFGVDPAAAPDVYLHPRSLQVLPANSLIRIPIARAVASAQLLVGPTYVPERHRDATLPPPKWTGKTPLSTLHPAPRTTYFLL
jgi:macrolide transport system ATP-binding/permease protein